MPRPILRTPFLAATAIVGALTLIPLATSAMAAVDTDTYREFDQFLDVFNRVKADYVDKVDDKTLIKGAVQGMLASLDPHSSYVDALDYENLRIMTEGNYGPRPDRPDGRRRDQGRFPTGRLPSRPRGCQIR